MDISLHKLKLCIENCHWDRINQIKFVKDQNKIKVGFFCNFLNHEPDKTYFDFKDTRRCPLRKYKVQIG